LVSLSTVGTKDEQTRASWRVGDLEAELLAEVVLLCERRESPPARRLGHVGEIPLAVEVAGLIVRRSPPAPSIHS
jgi:hypothetical protein